MDGELRIAFDIVKHDLDTGCTVAPEIRDDYAEGDLVGIWLYEPDGTGRAVSVPRGLAPAEQVVHLADQVQEWAVEALWRAGDSAVWPQCPLHPGTHPLASRLIGGRAAWTCPRTGTVVASIGGLA
jgi:hypothetical protein